jgi:hypothetical protein
LAAGGKEVTIIGSANIGLFFERAAASHRKQGSKKLRTLSGKNGCISTYRRSLDVSSSHRAEFSHAAIRLYSARGQHLAQSQAHRLVHGGQTQGQQYGSGNDFHRDTTRPGSSPERVDRWNFFKARHAIFMKNF